MPRTATEALPRVIHVSTAHLADDVRIYEREARSLAASGRYEVYVAAAGTIPPRSVVTHIPLRDAPSGRTRRFISGPRKGFALSGSVSADLWHFHDPELLPVCLRLSSAGVPVIWDAHEDYLAQFTGDGSKSWVPAPMRKAARSALAALLERVDRKVSGVIAATPTIAERYSNPNTVVVGNEARLEDFDVCRPRFDTRRCLFIGIAAPGHLFMEVVEAVRGLADVRLAVGGHDPDPAVWSSAQSILGDRLEHLGWLSREALVREMSASSVGLATDAPVPAYLDEEASPTKVYEFLAGGLPIVGTPTPSVANLLAQSKGGTLALGYGAQDLREAISRTLEDRERWERQSASGRHWARDNAGWRSSEERLLELYGTILGR